jgi:amino acid efflux transporter
VSETAPRRATPPVTPPLSTVRGAALYIGALLGPGLLLLPGLAVTVAGPASLLAWVALLVLSALFAVVFAAFGLRFPSAGGVIGYVTAGLGARAGLAAGWCFLAGVVAGAPVVCLIGASYVTQLTGGGQLTRAGVGALLLLILLALAKGGLRASAAAQLLLVGLLVGVVAVAVAGTAGSVRAANWTPFAQHGWLAVAHAAAILMLSFVGWEAVAPLTTAFRDPARQLTRVVAIALAVTSALYLGLAIVTIGVLGSGAATIVPLADLLQRAIGPAGTAAAAVAAVVLTLGSVNAYISGGAVTAGHLTRPQRVGRERVGSERLGRERVESVGEAPPAPRFLAAVAASGLLLITIYGFGVVSPAALVAIPTTLFLAVYLGCMVSAVRVLPGPARWAAVPASAAVTVMLACCGWALALPALVAVACFGQLRKGAQLPSRHHQIPDAHQPGHRRSTPGDDLQQQPGRDVAVGDEDVGHRGAHDHAGELHTRLDREDAAGRPAAEGGGEGLARPGFRQAAQLAGRPAAEVVDPVVGVRRQPDLRHPRPDPVGGSPHRHPAPRLQGRRLDDVVAGVAAGDLRVGDAPAVADHDSPASRLAVQAVQAVWRYRPRSGSHPAPSPRSVGQCRP